MMKLHKILFTMVAPALQFFHTPLNAGAVCSVDSQSAVNCVRECTIAAANCMFTGPGPVIINSAPPNVALSRLNIALEPGPSWTPPPCECPTCPISTCPPPPACPTCPTCPAATACPTPPAGGTAEWFANFRPTLQNSSQTGGERAPHNNDGTLVGLWTWTDGRPPNKVVFGRSACHNANNNGRGNRCRCLMIGPITVSSSNWVYIRTFNNNDACRDGCISACSTAFSTPARNQITAPFATSG